MDNGNINDFKPIFTADNPHRTSRRALPETFPGRRQPVQPRSYFFLFDVFYHVWNTFDDRFHNRVPNHVCVSAPFRLRQNTRFDIKERASLSLKTIFSAPPSPPGTPVFPKSVSRRRPELRLIGISRERVRRNTIVVCRTRSNVRRFGLFRASPGPGSCCAIPIKAPISPREPARRVFPDYCIFLGKTVRFAKIF